MIVDDTKIVELVDFENLTYQMSVYLSIIS